MKNLSINILKLFSMWVIIVFLVTSCGRYAYANGVHPHAEESEKYKKEWETNKKAVSL